MGHLIGHLLEEMRGVQIYGADISTESIYKVNQNYDLKPMFKGAFLPDELLRKKQHFEVILLLETIEHLDEKNMKKVFSDINQLLYSYGVLVITTPNNEDLKASEVYCPVCDHTFHRWQHMRSWNPEGLDKFLRESGFTVKSIQETDFSFPHHSTKAQLKRFAKYLLGRTISRPHLLAVACKT